MGMRLGDAEGTGQRPAGDARSCISGNWFGDGPSGGWLRQPRTTRTGILAGWVSSPSPSLPYQSNGISSRIKCTFTEVVLIHVVNHFPWILRCCFIINVKCLPFNTYWILIEWFIRSRRTERDSFSLRLLFTIEYAYHLWIFFYYNQVYM